MGDIAKGNILQIMSFNMSFANLICDVWAFLLQGLNTILVLSFLVHSGVSWVSHGLLTPFLIKASIEVCVSFPGSTLVMLLVVSIHLFPLVCKSISSWDFIGFLLVFRVFFGLFQGILLVWTKLRAPAISVPP